MIQYWQSVVSKVFIGQVSGVGARYREGLETAAQAGGIHQTLRAFCAFNGKYQFGHCPATVEKATVPIPNRHLDYW